VEDHPGEQRLINQILKYLGLIRSRSPSFSTARRPSSHPRVHPIPFTILPIFSSLQNISVDLIEAARDLGANRWSTFFKVVLPLSVPA